MTWVLPLDGADEAELRGRAGLLAQRLTASELPVVQREAYERAGSARFRCVVTGADATQLADRLAAIAGGGKAEGAEVVEVKSAARVAFLYPGIGTVRPGVGSGLMRHEAFANTVRQCEETIRKLAGWSLTAEQTRLAETGIGLPANIALQMSLTGLLRSWGIVPAVVLGHSLGEVSAAYASGGLSLADTLTVACHAAKLGQSQGKGAMLAIGGDASRLLTSHPEVSIAALNGPASTVVSGSPAAIAALAAELNDRNVFHRDLGVGQAFHSPQMEQHLDGIVSSLAGVRPSRGEVTMVSTVEGAIIPAEQLDSGHWARMLRRPVRFADAVAVAAANADVFLEVSATPELGAALAPCLVDYPAARVVTTLRPGRDEEDCLRRTAAALYLAGADIRWSAVPQGLPARDVRAVVGQILEQPASQIPVDAGLFALGLDSAGAILLAQRLGQMFPLVQVPLTIAFDYPTVGAITDFLAGHAAPVTTTTAKAAEPIAIIGMACRVPGADSAAELWELLRQGIDATGPRPAGRWETADYDDYPHRGGFLSEVDTFDAGFFGISPVEAERMDPQHRLLLEVSWHALEEAGLAPDLLHGRRCGVYVGLSTDDYKGLQFADPVQIDTYAGTGNLFCVAAGRLSYTLGLRGPSLAVDTGCSSSLVTVHLASQALRAGECEVALAGGVHVMLSADGAISLSKAGALSADGRCHTFDADADGYGRSEGCGVVVLKRLSDAIRDGDPIAAVIRGSAVNHDGASSGLTVPSGPAQQAVLREALACAGVSPAEVGYVEAHGSGTPLGDPIEMQALGAVYGESRDPNRPLLVGSIKTNLGHLEAAAGVAGLIKAALAVRRGWIPAHLNLRRPSPRIPWQELPVEVPVDGRPWPGPDRLAGVSSFGIGGTNAHVILSAPPEPASDFLAIDAFSLVPITARDPAALRDLAGSYARLLREQPDLTVAQVAGAAAHTRARLPYRAAVVSDRPAHLAECFDAIAGGQTPLDDPAGKTPNVAFAFCGQGSQYPGMGTRLAAAEPVFREAVMLCDEIAGDLVGGSLWRVMQSDDPELIHQTGWTHVALFAVQYGLDALWRSWGIQPSAVLGHSMGEVTAACAAGILSLPEAIRLVAARGRLMQQLPAGGRMAAVLAGERDIADVLAQHREVAAAAVNSPTETVISGRAAAVDAVVAELAARGVQTRDLPVSYAGHSPLVEPILDELESAAANLTYGPAQLDLVSTVTGGVLPSGAMDAHYWRRNARQPVRFYEAAKALLGNGCDLVIDMAPDPVLSKLAHREGLLGPGQRWIGSLRRGTDDHPTVLAAAAEAFCAGATLDWERLAPKPTGHVSLPLYTFQRRRYWRDTTGAVNRRAGHPLLGQRLRSPAISGAVFESKLAAPLPAHLADHGIYGETVAAAAYHLAAVIAALSEVDEKRFGLTGVTFTEPLRLDEPATVQVIVDAGSFQVVSGSGDQWRVHAAGKVTSVVEEEQPPRPESLPEKVDWVELQERMRLSGYHIGKSFWWLDEVSAAEGEAVARLVRPAAAKTVGGPHPGLIDSCLRTMLAAAPKLLDDLDEAALPVPVDIERFDWEGSASLDGPLWCRATLRPGECTAEMISADLSVHDAEGALVARLWRVRVRSVPKRALLRQNHLRFELAWHETSAPTASARPAGDCSIVADRGGVGARLTELVEESGGCGSAIVILSTLDEVADPVTAQRAGLFAAAKAVRAAVGSGSTPRIVMVTRNAQPVLSSDQLRIEHATLHGLARVLRVEHPELESLVLDLDEEDPDRAARVVLTALRGDAAEPQLAVRSGKWFVPRLAHSPTPAVGGIEPRRDGAYLVTGGAGGLGRQVASWLAERGAGRVYLAGRHRPGAEAVGELRWLTCDVTDAQSVAEAVAAIASDGLPLRGVVHAAGVLEDGALALITDERLATPLMPKLAGAWNLHQATEDLDFFVLFSSAAAVLGNPGQAGYAAGNAFLDALAAWRRRLGLPAVSLAWGPWEGDGMAARLSERDRNRLWESGLAPLSPDAALQVLETAAAGPALLVVADADWERLAATGDRGGLLASLTAAATHAVGFHPRPAGFGECLPPTTDSERVLVKIWEELFRIKPIGVTDNFFQLGGDSILGLRMLAAARQGGLLITNAEVFANPTVAQLASVAVNALVVEKAANHDIGLDQQDLEELAAQLQADTRSAR